MTFSYEQEVLKAMLRLARKQRPASEEALLMRVGGDVSSLNRALQKLEQAGLAERRGNLPPRLTLAGLAVGVAFGGKRVARPAGDRVRRLAA